MYIQKVKIQKIRRAGLVGCISFLPLLLDPLFFCLLFFSFQTCGFITELRRYP